MQFVHFILALAPIIWLMVALSVLKMPGYKACIITVIITAIESVAIWKFNPVFMLTAALEGAATSWKAWQDSEPQSRSLQES